MSVDINRIQFCKVNPRKNYSGWQFNKLKVISPVGRTKTYKIIYLCECNNFTFVEAGDLVSKHCHSCGCYNKEVSTTHGMKYSTEYTIWIDMVRRCHKTHRHNYSDYGGRGIYVCRRWRFSFENFFKDMGRRYKNYSIGRINNNFGYLPCNCKWVPLTEQALNRRNSIKNKYRNWR